MVDGVPMEFSALNKATKWLIATILPPFDLPWSIPVLARLALLS
jgi:hypothetical protein